MSVDVRAPEVPVHDVPPPTSPRRSAGEIALSVWNWTWPKLVAIGLVVLLWQILYWREWRPHWVLPSPSTVAGAFWDLLQSGRMFDSLETTMKRAITGYALALLIGTIIGIAVVQWLVFRRGVGSLVAAMQTMPSIAWFPLAVLFFGTSEKAILFVVVLGAAPSIASGLISGIDEVPPPLLRAGKMLGARGIDRYRYVVIPAAMPSYVQGMKQGWAFSWRSLLAGELIVQLASVTSLGGDLNQYRQTFQPDNLLAMMIMILVVGVIVDSLFGLLTKRIRESRGLTGATIR